MKGRRSKVLHFLKKKKQKGFIPVAASLSAPDGLAKHAE
jgi:hypothetical protein